MRRSGGINDEDKKGVWVSKWMVQNTPTPQAAIVLAELAYLNQPALRGTDRMQFTERAGFQWMVIPDALLADRIGLSEDGVYRARAALKKAELLEVLIAKVDGVKCCHVRLTLPEPEVAEDDPYSAEPRNNQTAEPRNSANRGSAEPFPSFEQEKENTPPGDPLNGFEEWYAAYPRKAEKDDAKKAYAKVRKKIPLEVLVAGAVRYRDDPNRDPSYTKNPATWLNKGCWDDEPERPRPSNGKVASGYRMSESGRMRE